MVPENMRRDIEHVFDEDNNEHSPVIDPDGYNVPLNLVMRAQN